jgi:hypothetical protein
MSVGVVVGTYSSVFVAASFALLWEGMMEKRRQRTAPAPVRAAEGKAREGKPAQKVSAGGRRR